MLEDLKSGNFVEFSSMKNRDSKLVVCSDVKYSSRTGLPSLIKLYFIDDTELEIKISSYVTFKDKFGASHNLSQPNIKIKEGSQDNDHN